MSIGAPGGAYASYLAFYEAVYAPQIVERRTAGRLGATMILTAQPSGDRSDAPTPDLILSFLYRTPPVWLDADLGAGRFVTPMRDGDFVVTAPHVGSKLLIDDAHRVLRVGINYAHLLDYAQDEALPQDGVFDGLHSAIQIDREVKDLACKLWSEAATGSTRGTLYADGIVLQILGGLLKLRDGTAKPSGAGLAPWQVRRVTDYLDDRLAEDISLGELAALVGRSPAHFCRAFKVSTGVPPHAWLLRRRIERAGALLDDRRLSLTDVAQLVGYSGQSTFGAAFRRVTGVTPSAWRAGR